MFGLGAPELLLIFMLFAIIVLPVAAIAVVLIIMNAQRRSRSPNSTQFAHQMNPASQHGKPRMPQPQQRFCTACGTPMEQGDVFCNGCGEKLETQQH